MTTNLEEKETDSSQAVADRGDSSLLGIPQTGRGASVLVITNGSMKARVDWLFCVKKRGSMMKKLVFVVIGIPTIVLVYFVISSALSTSNTSQVVIP